jgi:L-rhamnose mutarotase
MMSTSDSAPRQPQRICFTLRVRPELVDEYIARHSPVWPEMLAEIAASGRRDYSIFHLGGGLLVGVYETDDDEASRAYLAQSEVAARWEESMRPFFVELDARADQGAPTHPEVFHLETQLSQTRS